MKLYRYDNYRDLFPQLKGQELTDALILKSISDYGMDHAVYGVIRDHKGKPFLSSGSSVKECISVSHCLDTFVCLISDENCGIDIQDQRNSDFMKIARRFFTEEEAELVNAEGAEMFYRLWTRKEAFAKYTGTGMAGVIRGEQVIDREDVDFEDSVMDNGMYLAICTPKKQIE